MWKFLYKLGMKLPYDPTMPLLGTYPEKTVIEKDTYTPVFTAALFTIARTWKQPRCLLADEWIRKLAVRVCMSSAWLLGSTGSGMSVLLSWEAVLPTPPQIP